MKQTTIPCIPALAGLYAELTKWTYSHRESENNSIWSLLLWLNRASWIMPILRKSHNFSQFSSENQSNFYPSYTPIQQDKKIPENLVQIQTQDTIAKSRSLLSNIVSVPISIGLPIATLRYLTLIYYVCNYAYHTVWYRGYILYNQFRNNSCEFGMDIVFWKISGISLNRIYNVPEWSQRLYNLQRFPLFHSLF